MKQTTTTNQKGNGSQKAATKTTPRDATAEERKTGAIVCTQSVQSLRLICAAVRSWELRTGLALLLLCFLLAPASNAGTYPQPLTAEEESYYAEARQSEATEARLAAGKVADDESPCGAYVADAVCDQRLTGQLSRAEFGAAYPLADDNDYQAYTSHPLEWLTVERDNADELDSSPDSILDSEDVDGGTLSEAQLWQAVGARGWGDIDSDDMNDPAHAPYLQALARIEAARANK